MSNSLHLHDGRLYIGISIIFLLCAILNFVVKTGLAKKMMVAFIRSIIQLIFLGVVINYLFQLPGELFIFPIMLMVFAASMREASIKKIDLIIQRYFSIFFSVLPMGALSIYIINQEQLLNAKLVIPIFGMLIGNSLNGVVLGIERFQRELQHHQQLFISDLSLGLSPIYAAKKYIQVALRAAMTPILNAMSIVGIVSIPGMMTGQLLAGASPIEASKYQLLILVAIMGTIFIGAVFGVLWSLKSYTKNHYTFLSGRLRNG